MNNYIFLFVFILLTFFQIPSFSQIPVSKNPSFSQVPSQLKPLVTKLLKLPEARALLAQVSREGPVGIVMQNDPTGRFDAMWEGESRLIKVNPYRHPNEGSWICSILFELHNASTNQHMLSLFRSAEDNQFSKEIWVGQMERMEHTNALNTCRLLEKGIAQGIYPPEAHWTIFNSFDDYYKLQQITGHSHWLANMYDQSNAYSRRLPFQGTIPGLNHLTPEDKKDLQDYLAVKNNLKSSDQQEVNRSVAWLEKEYARLEECSLGKRQIGCFRTQEKLKLMRLVFIPETNYFL